MTLIQELTTKETAEREAALSTYREVLSRQADPQAGDGKRLRAAMNILNKSAADLESDLATLERGARLETQAALASDAELQSQLDAAGEALGSFRAETARIKAERDAEDSRLFGAWMMLGRRQRSGHEARGALAKLRARHWQLFGEPSPIPVARPEPHCTVGDVGPHMAKPRDPEFCETSGVGGHRRVPFVAEEPAVAAEVEPSQTPG